MKNEIKHLKSNVIGLNRPYSSATSLWIGAFALIVASSCFADTTNTTNTMVDTIVQSQTINKTPLTAEEESSLVQKATDFLDEWGGNTANVDQAGAFLSRVLSSNPNNLKAHFELARYLMRAGYINSENYKPGYLEKAISELDKDLQINPDYGNAYVLKGYIGYIQNNLELAITDYKRAQKLAADDHWLHINWGRVLLQKHDYAGAEEQLDLAKATPGLLKSEKGGLNEALISLYSKTGNVKKTQQAFLDDLELNPDSAWKHGNYSSFLLYTMCDPDASILESNKALRIMDYGMGRAEFGNALYVKWALSKDRHSEQAMKYLSEAKLNSPDLKYFFPTMAAHVGVCPMAKKTVLAFMDEGLPIDLTDPNGHTAFIIATVMGNLKSMDWLAKHGANINYEPHDSVSVFSALFNAINLHDVKTVKELIKLKADINSPNKDGYTPIMQAAAAGGLPIAKLLVESGADWNAGWKGGPYKAEWFAFRDGHPDVSAYLMGLRMAKQ